jgi:hypothetical protein
VRLPIFASGFSPSTLKSAAARESHFPALRPVNLD